MLAPISWRYSRLGLLGIGQRAIRSRAAFATGIEKEHAGLEALAHEVVNGAFSSAKGVYGR